MTADCFVLLQERKFSGFFWCKSAVAAIIRTLLWHWVIGPLCSSSLGHGDGIYRPQWELVCLAQCHPGVHMHTSTALGSHMATSVISVKLLTQRFLSSTLCSPQRKCSSLHYETGTYMMHQDASANQSEPWCYARSMKLFFWWFSCLYNYRI